MKAESTFSLKDELFNSEKVEYLAGLISDAHPKFPVATFRREVIEKFPELELKERIVHITRCLENHLPDSFSQSCRILLKSLPPELDPNLSDNDFGDFIFAPVSHFIVLNGCTKKQLDRSLAALREITKRFSAEDAIRYFINQFPGETFAFLEDCSLDRNYHVRRLASEGTRPKLPWSQKLTTPYEKAVPILEELHKDPTRYVTRSVANHLNDISKLDPEAVISLLKKWRKQKQQSGKELEYITRHALRTLVKSAHPGALSLLGFPPNPDVSVERFFIENKRVKIGGAADFQLHLESRKKQNLLIDYYMEFPGGRGRIFKWKQYKAGSGESVELNKRHPMKLMTTRALVPGAYRVTLQINGKRLDTLSFDLCEP
ncbi:MAG: hypothetical protein P1V20_13765 [Verrucomicrobiales bacterium]|nr:hypothetical protein [Verrucomicrobiales bacterium]